MKKLLTILILININVYASSKIDQAIDFLQKGCVSKGYKTEIISNGKADFTIRNWQNMGIMGEVTFKSTEIEGLSATLDEFSSKQASEIRKCMQPYIDKILNIILGVNDSSSHNKKTINQTADEITNIENQTIINNGPTTMSF